MLGDMAFVAGNHRVAGLMIALHDRLIVFGIELGGQGSGAHQVAERDGQLTALRWVLGVKDWGLGRKNF